MRIPILTPLYEAGLGWNKDNASFLGAAVAYYALFSIAPLLIVGIAIVGVVYGAEAVEDKMVGQLAEHVGIDAAQTVEVMIKKAWHPENSWLATILGGALLLATAANLFRQLRVALDMLWGLPPLPHRYFWVSTVVSYLLAVAMVLVTGCFWLALMVGDTALTFFINSVGDALPGGEFRWKIGQFGLLFGLLTLFFILTFRFLSHGRIRYRHLWFGSMVGAMLFMLGRLAFGYYLGYMGAQLATGFGAASSLVIFLVWVYYSAQIFFYAAEVVKVDKERAEGKPPAPLVALGS